jgi:GNAT superfamily N-acetyltransferase
MAVSLSSSDVTVRRMAASDLDAADQIMRLAFGTFLQLPDPMAFLGDGDYVRTRWTAAPDAALTAEINGKVVGSNFATRWGSVGFFGPLTVTPHLWNEGVGQRLLHNTMELMGSWDLAHTGLFTFGHSPKHISLYGRYGFHPRFLIAVMSANPASATDPGGWTTWRKLSDQAGHRDNCRSLTDAIFPGLDVTREIHSCHEQELGDTVLLEDGSGFAICHVGAGSEAGSDKCYIKFAAARGNTSDSFVRLIRACEAFAFEQGATRIEAGVSVARRRAYQILSERGYRADLIGVAMHRPDEPGYHRPDALVLDDWR